MESEILKQEIRNSFNYLQYHKKEMKSQQEHVDKALYLLKLFSKKIK